MNSRIVVLYFISAFSLFALVATVSAQTRTVGVTVGNKFRYSTTASYFSNDPSATPPSYLVDLHDTKWVEITITAISGTNITGQMTRHYENGTEITVSAWVDVDTGDGENMKGFVISAFVLEGDPVYTSSPYNTWIINETVPRTYVSAVRETNHLNMTPSIGDWSYRTNMYWDMSTGVAVEILQEGTNQSGAYITTWSSAFQIISSDLWIVPEFSTWTPGLLMLMALASATVVIAKQRRHAR